MTGATDFADPARESAHAFRAVLDAIARPGRVVTLDGPAPPAGLSPAAATLLLTLADPETPVFLPAAIARGEAASWLAFATGAPLAATRAEAVLALGPWSDLLPLADWPAGTPDCPDRSTTLIVEAAALEGGAPLELRGPGIEGRTRFAPALPDGAREALAANAARFPLGVDVFFCAGARVAGLPRSTRIGG